MPPNISLLKGIGISYFVKNISWYLNKVRILTTRLFYWGIFLSRNTFINFAQFHRSYIDFMCMSSQELLGLIQSLEYLCSHMLCKKKKCLKSSFHLVVFLYNVSQFVTLFIIQVLWHLLRQIHMVKFIQNWQNLHPRFDAYYIGSNPWWRFYQFSWPS